jgi:hypothetical protein
MVIFTYRKENNPTLTSPYGMTGKTPNELFMGLQVDLLAA